MILVASSSDAVRLRIAGSPRLPRVSLALSSTERTILKRAVHHISVTLISRNCHICPILAISVANIAVRADLFRVEGYTLCNRQLDIEMLSDSDLDRLFAERNTPEAGRNLIRKARAQGPVRDIQRNNDTVRTRYISRKMGGLAVLAESRTVELPAIVLKEKSETTLEYWAQPFTVDMTVVAPNGGTTRVRHTPDILDINTKEFGLGMVGKKRDNSRVLGATIHRRYDRGRAQAGHPRPSHARYLGH